MPQHKTPEFKKMIGRRYNDSETFVSDDGRHVTGTYFYGALKLGVSVRSSSETTKRSRRAHKRAVKAKEMAREQQEWV